MLAPEAVPEEAPVALAVVGEEVEYFNDSRGYYAKPAAEGSYPGVVMIHENRGLREEIKRAADELAAEGYRVLAVDLYKGTVMQTQEEARAYSSQYDRAVGIQNMRTATAFLRKEGAPKIASLGWCFGGAESLALSTSGENLDATVIYYGRLPEDQAVLTQLKSPVLGIFGSVDQVVPTSSVAVFESNLKNLGVPAEIYMYEGVGHAFANPSNPNFAPAETADAWGKTLAFLEQHLQ
ncbi:dienelactone hydrolase family protein [Patescibacteria group bacterium]|nr:dienelactone hydrolase family protein [Patescibacteria group bacterium]